MGSVTDSPDARSHYSDVIGSMVQAIANDRAIAVPLCQKERPMESQSLASPSSLYVVALTWAFMLTNALRVFTYLPTIVKLLKPDVTGDCQSTLTWFLWTVSNATFALHLFETNHRKLDEVVLFSAANTLMCLICLSLVYRVQSRSQRNQVPHWESSLPSRYRNDKQTQIQ
jgi:hypothetical protein